MIPFPDKKYQIIYADPPWDYGNSTFGKRNCDDGSTYKESYFSGLRYSCMSLDEIKNLPVVTITNTNCILFLWTTGPFLKAAFDVITSWGFTYKTMGFVWVKTTLLAKGRKGSQDGWLKKNLGKWTLSSTEFILLATKGSPKRVDKTIRQLIMSPISKHSKKPDEAKERIKLLCGDVPRIELFARQRTEGWDVWGNEV